MIVFQKICVRTEWMISKLLSLRNTEVKLIYKVLANRIINQLPILVFSSPAAQAKNREISESGRFISGITDINHPLRAYRLPLNNRNSKAL